MRVEVASSHRKYAVDEGEVRRLARGVSRHEKAGLRFVSIVAVGHGWMRKLNRQFLRRDETTDVLAFSLGDNPEVEGEIYVNLDQACRQARHYGVSLTNEVTRLVIHGLLHLIGYRDKKLSERRVMRAREEELVRILDRGKTLRS
ncbi:MAG: rRNA maturation RNase YbeY [Bacteroidota bacterium]